MQAELIGWIQAGGSIVLIGVTAWYAWLTSKMSKAAVDSAESARLAAEAASASVLAAMANIKVEFRLAQSYYFTNGKESLGVSVWSAGSTVFVHRAHLRVAYYMGRRTRDGGWPVKTIAQDHSLEPVDVDLPIRLHRNERVEFVLSPALAHPNPPAGVSRLEMSIWYSLDGRGEGTERIVTWDNPESS
ncbi:hypothetical protein E0W80_04420 [Microbacterium sp. PI-1]|uniref:hypothetical protein n=1 Tax=Microbacterium sp. PI-1 TaxID=2545631 RepID=UPI00103937C3|nr:hypothetical protein [Microbacterium sp. PI-1]TCJ28750.1 hypothetical protein E0W80_04420 [Microbacterium sp. PI-1]